MARDAEQLEQLTAYLDGELGPGQRAEVDRLLDEDPDTRALLHELRQTSRLVSALPRAAAPGGLADAVTSRMERQDLLGESSPQRATIAPEGAWARRFAVAASMALVGTAVWIAWPHLSQLIVDEKQPLQLAQADKSLKESTPQASRKERGRGGLGISRSLSPAPGTAFGDATIRSMARTKAPLALDYGGDDADREALSEKADAMDETMPASAERLAIRALTFHLRERSPFATTQPSTQPATMPTTQAAPRPTTQEVPGG